MVIPKIVHWEAVALACVAVEGEVNGTVTSLNYSVEGSFSYTVQRSDRPSVSHRRDFIVVVQDGCWKITVTPEETRGRGCCVYQYVQGDLASYSVITVDGTNSTSGIIESGEVPQVWLAAGGEYVWLAYASSRYFERATNGSAVSLQALRSPAGLCRRVEVPADVELCRDPPHLPEKVRYMADKQQSLGDDGTIRASDLAGFIKEGYVSAEMKCGGFTNVGGAAFPTHFEYRLFGPRDGGRSPSDLRCLLVVGGGATNIVVGRQSIDSSLPTADAAITDLRVAGEIALLRISNGTIPSASSPEAAGARSRARALLAAAAGQQKDTARVIERKRLAVVALLVLCSLPLVFSWVENQKRKHVKQQAKDQE